ncbi:amino acid adenylation domain-containing protein [Micromonospora rubida]|uniref:amino acid adenylation domain-containing protein n=1 Tax=Micromonospora rubida TaxID=2697657 RepID=UPI001378B22C|nr:amino acid adenylation domain-containing protein [Micromonospora rubida]NBE83206.1 amino acid adenylation domain-containing protein [Micromonospora rubida]
MEKHAIIDRFARVAAEAPARPALLGEGPAVSYADLAAAAGGHAALLAAAGVRPGERVALLTPHGTPTVVAILGTLAAGCAYVPLDPGFPADRLRHMLAAADVRTVLAAPEHRELAARLAADRPGTAVLTADAATPAPLRPTPVDPGALAYVLFTSGSTGLPKAVGQTHRNLAHVVDNQIAALGIGPDDRLSLLASFSFDAAIPDLYPALLTGAAVVPVDLRRHGLAHAVDQLVRHRVTVYHSTPTVYRFLLDALGDRRLDAVRAVLLGGEQATFADAARGRDRFAPCCVLVNGYGATEMTFAARYALPLADADPAATGPLPIGTALPGYEVDLAPDSGEIPGSREIPGSDENQGTGEIVVRGRHVAPGYLDRADDRFSRDADGIWSYRTGDLGARLPDGGLVCLGRLDRQVKVRGFRVELTEIEAVLAAQSGVGAVRAIARDGELLAYARPAGGPLDPAALRVALARRLPEYALPRAVVVVDEFPLTVTGKVDERALPDPARDVPAGEEPATATERAVHDIWCAVLGRPAVARTASFFDVGGQSLLLGVVQQRLAERFGVRPPLLRLFENPTVEAQARLVDAPPVPGRAPVGPAPVAPAAAAREYTGDEIAVVGMAGRFPGAEDLATFWWNLCAGVDAIHDHTDEELAALGIGPRLLADPRHVRATGRLDAVADFDADFFAFGAQEAARTDPQHRLFLETAWEALEDAGHDPSRFPGLVGVYSATSANRYFLFHLMDNPAVVGDVDPDDWEARLIGRQSTDHLPGQVAYRLGLTGPAMAVQSACSSSLVAVCVAAQSLADYQCDIALAGGVNVTWPRYRHTAGGMASPDGRCRAFDEAANGSGFGSGVGVVALRRLADAQADGDRVYAVLPGWAVTNDGADRAGFAVPGPTGQAAAVAGALAAAEVAPGEVRFIEAHGSGTPLGDALEVAALHEVYGGAAPAESCALGSVKTNIGHLDAAAGIAGLIKTVLAVQHGVIPPNLHFTRPHPEIDLAGGPFHVPTKARDWPQAARRVAGVSSFGLGGTNAHVVVEQPPPVEPADAPDAAEHLLPVSARTPAALRSALTRLRRHLAGAAPALAEVAATLALGRRAFACRAAVVAGDPADALAGLDALLAADARPAADAPSTAGAQLAAGGRVAGPPGELRDLAADWVAGRDVDLADLHPEGRVRRTGLPTYPFQRQRHWIDPPQKGLR